MPQFVDSNEFLSLARHHEVIDVRSPSEYARGHIVGAINVPLFDDDQRASIGITYKQNGREQAVLKGLDMIGPKMKRLAKSILQIVRDSDKEPVNSTGRSNRKAETVLIHCWRGGMRSQSLGWLAEQVGVNVVLLEGGYKSFRRHVLESFKSPVKAVILSGLTGSGKTLILNRLRDADEQVIDLEGLANHRGSALGGIGLPDQPTVEHFENMLFHEVQKLDPSRHVWLEDESRKIGSATIPNDFLIQMRNSPAVFLDVPRKVRADIAIEEYGELPMDEIKDAINRVTKRMGGQNTKAACDALDRGDLTQCVDLLLDYYDKSYLNAKARSPRETIVDLPTSDPVSDSTVSKLIEHAQSLWQMSKA